LLSSVYADAFFAGENVEIKMDAQLNKYQEQMLYWMPSCNYISEINKEATESLMNLVKGGDSVIEEMSRFIQQSMDVTQESMMHIAEAKTPTDFLGCQLNFFTKAASMMMEEASHLTDMAVGRSNGGSPPTQPTKPELVGTK
jgi:Phasin protein